MRTLAVVPARAGSKGLPGKNLRPFLGVSLLERAFRIADQTCDDVVVTTDSAEIAKAAWNAGAGRRNVHFRPPELATDEAPMLPVVQDAIRGREGDVIVLLQPTQPLRTAGQVRQAIAMMNEPWPADSVVAVVEVPEAYRPDRVLHCERERLAPATTRPAARRQDARRAYVRDGRVYVMRRAWIEAGNMYGAVCRPLILDGDALSIDTLEDFERLAALARRSDGTQVEA